MLRWIGLIILLYFMRASYIIGALSYQIFWLSLMNYKVLARKWRPQQFEALIGQNHVTRALQHALRTNRLHHAYLFTGTRGSGKTTIARIIAKCLNCEQGVTPTPCGQCGACVAIETGRFIDLQEIDAASKTKVEDTRDLLENVMYAPTQGRYKIYLIDEVHMLSGHSFNALLKTLEEPPAHVIFLLATTDPQKLPITILSRCLQFQLKAMGPELLVPHFIHILQQEQIAFEEAALNLLAQAAKGSVRDGLSLLDQAIAAGEGSVNRSTVSEMLGMQGQQFILPLAEQVLSRQLPEALALCKQLTALSVDFDYFLDELMRIFHDLSIKLLAPDFILNNPLVTEQEWARLATLCDASDIQLFYQIALLAKRDLGLAPSKAVGFEMALLRMIAFKVEAHATRASSANQQAAPVKRSVAIEAAVPTSTMIPEAPQSVVADKPADPAPAKTASAQQQTWYTLLPQLGLTAFAKALAEHLHFERREGDHFYFSLEQEHAPMLQEKHRQRITQSLSDYFKRPMSITVQIGRAQKTQASSMIAVQAEEKQMKKQQASTELARDGHLQKILKQFDGTIIPETETLNEKGTL